MTTSVVFLHSTGTLPSMWDASPVPAGLEVLKPANLGYPPLPVLSKPTPVTVDDDVANIVRRLPPNGPLHLISHSYGGLIALKLLPMLGARVASVFLYEPVLFGALSRSKTADPGAVSQAVEMLATGSLLNDVEAGGGETWLGHFIDFWNKPGSWERMPDAMKAFSRSVGWKMYQEVRSVFFDPSSFADHLVSAPLTLVKGSRSPISSRAMIDELARVNPKATVRDLNGTGHMAPLTHSALFVEAVAEHWSRLGF